MQIDLKQIFNKRIKIEPKVRSISGVFINIDNELETTNYEPSYQRNYVWDDEKASYFIESIFLGTEVPPIIMFKSDDCEIINYEVIDGRQRYQTILRFINNELKLKKNGLQKLGEIEGFAGKSYSDLSDNNKALFEETKIRVIEYSFLTDYTSEEEEAVKREIFQRYNSGITPLKTFEIDKAQYFYNELNSALKEYLDEDNDLDTKVTRIFRLEKSNYDQKATKLRELFVLHRIPISYYAIKKQKVVGKYFEYLSTQITEEEIEELFVSFKWKVNKINEVANTLTESGASYNRLYAECLFWAFSVLDENCVESYKYDLQLVPKLAQYLKLHEDQYTTVRSTFYGVLMGRYKTTALFFEKEYGCDFSMSLYNNESFKKGNKELVVEPKNTNSLSFTDLRINKPEPTSVELTELIHKLKSNRFLIRPSYQRAEVHNKRKSSSIIESLLLGVMLPPIFVYKRKNGVSEVIDGQQRLLSIISYIGETYRDEEFKEQRPILYGFKLDLGENAILRDLRGNTYSELDKSQQNKIRKSSIYIIEIKEESNPEFDPVDLFVRLNNKPYPIACDSFEMWNSFAPRSIIDLVRNAVSDNEKWFYFRKNNARMDNENLFSTLAYFQHQVKKIGIKEGQIAPDKTVEVYGIDNRIACRFRARNEITKLLYGANLEDFRDTINSLEFGFVSNVYNILEGHTKNASALNKSFDELLCFEKGKRSQMLFYILWILLHDLACDIVEENRINIFNDVNKICRLLDNCNNPTQFQNEVIAFRKKYESKNHSMHFPLGNIVRLSNDADSGFTISQLYLDKRPGLDNRFSTHKSDGYSAIKGKQYGISMTRQGIEIGYVEAYLRSKLFYHFYKNSGEKMIDTVLFPCMVPFISVEEQRVFANIVDYIDGATDINIRRYFERILDLMFYEKYFENAFTSVNVLIVDVVKSFPSLQHTSEEEKQNTISDVYKEQTKASTQMSMYLLKAIDITIVKDIEDIL